MSERKRPLSVLVPGRVGRKPGVYSADLTLRHVQVFFMLWNSNSVSDVARKLGVTQPAISAALASLENLCGFELFHRKPGAGMHPTLAAVRLYPYVDRAFRALNDLAAEVEVSRVNPNHGKPWRHINVLLEEGDYRSKHYERLAQKAEALRDDSRDDAESKS